MSLFATTCAWTHLPSAAPALLPPLSLATFGVGDTLLIVVVALIVFGPKKLPEISRQLGKLLYEFRKASNDFKYQIEEELRSAEQAERQKQLQAQAATPQPATPVAITADETVSAEPEAAGVTSTILPLTIQPPSTGLPVAGERPYGSAPAPAADVTAETAVDSPEEMQVESQEAVRSYEHAAAEQSGQPADAVPTHHG